MNKFNGLKLLPRDKRDFKLGAIIKLPELSELPDEFILGDLPVKNQAGNIAGEDLCSAFGSTLISEFQEGVELSPEWSFAVSKKISGDVEGFGQDMRTAMKVHQKYGAVEKSEAVIPANPRYLANWDASLIEKAKKHKKQAYVGVEGQHDAMDSIRASIWHFRNEERAVSLGVIWSWNLSDKILSTISSIGFGHFVVAIGWKKINGITYLVIQNSYDKTAGENGRHYISREVVNFFAKRYGAMMFIDEDPNDLKKNWSIYVKILDAMRKILDLMFKQTEILKEKEIEEEKMIESISDEIPPEVKPKYNWDNKENSRHSARMIMDDYDLKWEQKDLLCAVIEAESNFNVKAINNTTRDYGICQINEKYWIGEGKYFSSIEEVLEYPAKSVKFMIEQYQKGHLDYWVAYKNESYKHYL